MSDELNDDLSDLLDGKFDGERRQPRKPPAFYQPMAAQSLTFQENCPRCGGTGRYGSYGQCFACKGAGRHSFKTSPEARAKGRASADKRRRNRDEERAQEIAEWKVTNKAEWEWMQRAVSNPKFDFPAKMVEALHKWGSLTDGQLNGIRKCMLRDAAWVEKRQQAEVVKPTVDVSRLEAAFASARAAAMKLHPNAQGVWVRPLRLRDGEKGDPKAIDLSFTPGSPGSEWDGMIFVRNREDKLGWIKDHKFTRRFACTDADEEALGRVLKDPEQAAKAYAQAYSQCGVCGRTLMNAESIKRGYGPICGSFMGWG